MEKDLTQALVWITQFIEGNWQAGGAALAGTFFGAFFAFLFERRHSEKKEREANIASLKYAQLTIWAQLNGVTNIKTQVLDPTREDEHRYLTLHPSSVHAQYPSLNVPSLVFMLRGDGTQLVADMMLAEHKFRTLVGTIEQRNVRHEMMQRQMAQVGPEATLDAATVAILKDMTDAVFDMSDDAFSSLNSSYKKLGAYVEREFPGVIARPETGSH